MNAGGLVACVDPGTTTVGASYDGQTAQTTVTCTATVLTAVSVTPADASIAIGATIQYAASGLFSSGQQCDVTQAAQWQSSAPSVASIVATSPDAGLATGLEAGTSQISAIAGGQTGTTTLTVQ